MSNSHQNKSAQSTHSVQNNQNEETQNPIEYWDFCNSPFEQLSAEQVQLLKDDLNISDEDWTKTEVQQLARTHWESCRRTFLTNSLNLMTKNLFEYQAFNPVEWRKAQMKIDGFKTHIFDLVLLGLTAGNKVNMSKRVSSAVQRINELNGFYKFRDNAVKQSLTSTDCTLVRCVLSYPMLASKMLIKGLTEPKLGMRGLPIGLSFTGSSQLVPENYWTSVRHLFVMWNTVFGYKISQGRKRSNKGIVEAYNRTVRGAPVNDDDLSNSAGFIDLSRNIPLATRTAYDRYFHEIVSDDELAEMITESAMISSTKIFRPSEFQ